MWLYIPGELVCSFPHPCLLVLSSFSFSFLQVWLYILGELGIHIGAGVGAPPHADPETAEGAEGGSQKVEAVTLQHLLAVYPLVYPYLPLPLLGKNLWGQQVFMVTHLVLVMSRYGRAG